ncbi:LOW QUALITY PROTEIN: kinesin-like protein KIF18B [Microcebus murinus]|uniref:LOW QUALITY PROTEIN: kinesin-like protein KIF18B n=1 Tax=Microcebus murinus TaxID=30608 RepID=UPI003F6C487D
MVMAVEDSMVRVVVRVRPPTPRELDSQRRPVVQVVDERVLVFNPEEPDGGFPGLKWGGTQDGPKRKGKDLTFVFDRVFGEAATQQDVFQHTTHSILDGFLQGYNCSVFAYGATGAGKTHTMLGREGDPGIMYLTTVELYRRLEALQEEKHFEVLICYQEVYNEQIHDLLEPKGPLAIREDPDKGVVVQGLSFHQPASAEQLLEMLTRGNRNRTQHPTDANAASSRSHAIFQIFVKQQDRVPGLTQAMQVAKMSLIDLAGSERASSTGAKGERLREGASINRSLLALINVLNALADAKGRKSHVPYRDSKLTRLLKDSLGGNCRTVMIAAVSPSSLAYEDTYNTLKYADRAKEIRLSLKSNVISLDCHISQYATICQQLQAEVAALRKKLQAYEAGAQPPHQDFPGSPKLGPLIVSSTAHACPHHSAWPGWRASPPSPASAPIPRVRSSHPVPSNQLSPRMPYVKGANDTTAHRGSNYYSRADELRGWVSLLLKPENPWLLLPPSFAAHLSPKYPSLMESIPSGCHRDPAPYPAAQTLTSPLSLPSSPLPPCPLSQPCTPELPMGSGTLQEESLGTEAQVERVVEGNSSDQEQSSVDKDKGPAVEVPIHILEQSPRHSLPGLLGPTLQPKPIVGDRSTQKLDRDHPMQLALKVLCLAQRQYSLLQAANLLTPDMIAEFETLQQLVQEEKNEPGAEPSRTPGLARGTPLAQELCSESKSPAYSGPVTRTMARRLSGPMHTLGIPPGPECSPTQASRWPMEKKKRRRPSPSEPDSPPAPKQRNKRQRQSFLPCLRRESLPEAQPSFGPSTPKGGRASSPCHSSPVCPATVIKSRVPLGPSAMQNCSAPLAPPTRDLNATFDLSEETPSKLSFREGAGWEKVPQELNRPDQPFMPSGPVLFTMKGPKPTSSLPGTSTCKKRRIVSSSVSRGHSRIARLPSSTLKRPAGPLTIPAPPSNWPVELSLSPLHAGDRRSRKELSGVGRVLSAGNCIAKVS